MKLARLTAGAALAAAAVLVPAAPAQAVPTAAVVDLQLVIACYGCGPSSGTLSGTASGVGRVPLFGPVGGSFSFNGPGATCPATGTASGTMSGSTWSANFNWTQVGAVGVVTTSGGVNGTGTIAFRVEPGNPCGGTNVRVDATMTLGSTDSGGVDPGDPPVDASADPDGYGIAVGDEVESGAVSHADVSQARSNHQHNSTAQCAFSRSRQQVTVNGHMTLGAHAGHRNVYIYCELYNRNGSLIYAQGLGSTGGHVRITATFNSSSTRHRICMYAQGVWNDSDTVTVNIRCRWV